jgi:hypothetical protein
MAALLTPVECQSVHTLITSSTLALENLHTRNYRTQGGIRILRHLNAMTLQNGVINGFVSGPSLSIEYEIDNTGQVSVNASTLTLQSTLAYLNRFIKREILQRVQQGHSSYGTRLTNGHYYLRRSRNPRITKAAKKAVAGGLLSQKFVNAAVRWNIRVIIGGGA